MLKFKNLSYFCITNLSLMKRKIILIFNIFLSNIHLYTSQQPLGHLFQYNRHVLEQNWADEVNSSFRPLQDYGYDVAPKWMRNPDAQGCKSKAGPKLLRSSSKVTLIKL